MGRKTTGDSPIARYKIARRLEWREIQAHLGARGWHYGLGYLSQVGSGKRDYNPKLDARLKAVYPDYNEFVG